MPTTSRIAIVEDALFDLLVAASADPVSPMFGVPVSAAHPGEQLQREHVWIGASVIESQEWATTGSGSQAKAETTPVNVMFRSTDSDYATARGRVLDLVGALEDIVRQDAHLGVGTGQVWDSDVPTIEKDAWMDQDGWVVAMRVTVRARSWLS
jgi:hypothetical protein